MKAFFLILVLATLALATDISAPLTIEKARAKFVLPVSVDVATGLTSYQFNLLYDPDVLSPVGGESGNFGCSVESTIAAHMDATCNEWPAGTLRVVAFGSLPIVGGGTVLNITFLGQVGETDLLFKNVRLSAGNGPIPLTITDGHVWLE